MGLFLKILLGPALFIIGGFLVLAIIVGIVMAIFGKKPDPEEVKRKEAEEAERRRIAKKYEDTYENLHISDKAYYSALYSMLLKRGKESLHAGNLEKALEYLEDCRTINNLPDVKLAFAEYYATIGDRKNASELLKEATSNYNADSHFMAILLHMTDDPVGEFEKGKEIMQQYDRMAELLQPAQKQMVQDTLDGYAATVQKASEVASTGNYAEAAQICRSAYDVLVNYTEKGERAGFREKLTELAWMIAVNCCATDEYQQYVVAKEYLDKEDCSHYPTYYYIYMLAKTCGGKSGFDDPDYLFKAFFTHVERAIREGLPNAEQVKARLDKTFSRSIEIGLDNALYALEQIEAEEAFEEEHGMSREEYEVRQQERREKEEKTKREQKLRAEFEWAEGYWDLMTGGTGRDVEQMRTEGAVSFADYALYNAAKEKYIKKKYE